MAHSASLRYADGSHLTACCVRVVRPGIKAGGGQGNTYSPLVYVSIAPTSHAKTVIHPRPSTAYSLFIPFFTSIGGVVLGHSAQPPMLFAAIAPAITGHPPAQPGYVVLPHS